MKHIFSGLLLALAVLLPLAAQADDSLGKALCKKVEDIIKGKEVQYAYATVYSDARKRAESLQEVADPGDRLVVDFFALGSPEKPQYRTSLKQINGDNAVVSVSVTDKKDKTYRYDFDVELGLASNANVWVISDIHTREYPSVRKYFQDFARRNYTFEKIMPRSAVEITAPLKSLIHYSKELGYSVLPEFEPQIGAVFKIKEESPEDCTVVARKNGSTYELHYVREDDGHYRLEDIILPGIGSEKQDMLKFLRERNYDVDLQTGEFSYIGSGPKAGMSLSEADDIPGVRFYIGHETQTTNYRMGGVILKAPLYVVYQGRRYPTNVVYDNSSHITPGWRGPRGLREADWPYMEEETDPSGNTGYILYCDEWEDVGGKITGGGPAGGSKKGKKKKK